MRRIAISLTIINLILFLILILSFCSLRNKKSEIKKEFIIQKDTIKVYKYDTIRIPKMSVIIKTDTIRIKDSVYIKSDTSFIVPLFKHYYQDSILYLEFLANYVDSSSLRYKLFIKPKQIRKDNILTISANVNSYGIIYQKRVFYNFYFGIGIEKELNDYKFKAYFSLIW